MLKWYKNLNINAEFIVGNNLGSFWTILNYTLNFKVFYSVRVRSHCTPQADKISLSTKDVPGDMHASDNVLFRCNSMGWVNAANLLDMGMGLVVSVATLSYVSLSYVRQTYRHTYNRHCNSSQYYHTITLYCCSSI